MNTHYGQWIVLAEEYINNIKYVRVRCICGVVKLHRIYDLEVGKTTMCNKCSRELSASKIHQNQPMSHIAYKKTINKLWKKYPDQLPRYYGMQMLVANDKDNSCAFMGKDILELNNKEFFCEYMDKNKFTHWTYMKSFMPKAYNND